MKLYEPGEWEGAYKHVGKKRIITTENSRAFAIRMREVSKKIMEKNKEAYKVLADK